MKVRQNIDQAVWNEFVKESPYRTPFQTKHFFDLINSIDGYEAKVFAAEENGIEALCVVTFQKEKGIKGFFSRRAIIYGGPILTQNKQAVTLLLKEISAIYRNAIYIETRNFNDYKDYSKEFKEAGWQFEPYQNFHLNCSSEDVVWNNFNSNRQRQIKKALKTGVKTEEAKTAEDVKQFYNILEDLYNSKVKKPLFPIEFFENLVKSEVGKILLVKFEEKIIGGIACPIMPGKTIYELYICGLDQEYKDCYPSVMATYAAIEYGFKNNISRFDFMGAGKAGEDYGVRDFKGKFGGELVEHGRFIKVNNKFFYGLGKLAIGILSGRKSKAKK